MKYYNFDIDRETKSISELTQNQDGVNMKQLFESFQIRNLTIKNRVCVPPMVCFNWSDENGYVTELNVEHYRAIAKGQPGLIIQEATCITSDGKLHASQLGIWSDAHIDGLRQITAAVHQEGCPILLQIHHAGVVGIAKHPLCPDSYELKPDVVGKKMTDADILEIREAFIQAGRRAYEAGYDGVEIHGCHKYLLCQFLNSQVNHREDLYGRKPEQLIIEIIEGIRKEVSEDFIIGIRLGAFEPTLEDGLRHAAILEKHGIDFFDISYGFIGEHDIFTEGPVTLPADYPFKDIIYAAGEFKKQCKVPVFAVNSIRTPADAQSVLEITDVDMVDIGRSILVDPDWPLKAKNEIEPGKCLGCKVCQWRIDYTKCPGLIKMRAAN